MDYQNAERDVRSAAICAFVVVGLTSSVVLLAILTEGQGRLQHWDDPLNFIDAAFIAVLGIAVLRYSRVAAVILFAYYLLSKVYLAVEAGQAMQLLGLVLLYFFWRGIRGSFAYHKLRLQEDPNYRVGRWWIYVLAIPPGLVVALLIGIGVLSEYGILPAAEVVSGEELSRGDRAWFREAGVLQPDEKVELFYSNGILSNREDGNVLTDKRVVAFETWEGAFNIYAVPFDEIARVEVTHQGDFLSDTIVTIQTVRGEAFELWLSAENDGDKDFVERIRQRLPSE